MITAVAARGVAPQLFEITLRCRGDFLGKTHPGGPPWGARIPSKESWRAPRIDYLNGGVGTLRIAPNPFLGILDKEVADVDSPTPRTAFWALFLLLRRRGDPGRALGGFGPRGEAGGASRERMLVGGNGAILGVPRARGQGRVALGPAAPPESKVALGRLLLGPVGLGSVPSAAMPRETVAQLCPRGP